MSKKFKYIQAGDQSLDSLHDGRIQKFHYFKYENLQSSIISVWEPFCDFFLSVWEVGLLWTPHFNAISPDAD